MNSSDFDKVESELIQIEYGEIQSIKVLDAVLLIHEPTQCEHHPVHLTGSLYQPNDVCHQTSW